MLPTAAISWRPHERLQVYVRGQTGFRSGGLAVDPAGMVNRFESDKIYTIESGVRFGDRNPETGTPLSGSATVFYTHWRDIQADLLDSIGLPTTLNIGRGHVTGLQANLDWRPNKAWLIEGAVFINKSSLDNPAAELIDLENISLPNVPRYGGRLSLRWSRPISGALNLQTDATVRYRSGSNLGTLPPLLLEQGECVETDLAVALASDAWKLTVEVTNLLNARKNSFSFGNPFTAALGDQITPLRPRSIRIGVSFGF